MKILLLLWDCLFILEMTFRKQNEQITILRYISKLETLLRAHLNYIRWCKQKFSHKTCNLLKSFFWQFYWLLSSTLLYGMTRWNYLKVTVWNSRIRRYTVSKKVFPCFHLYAIELPKLQAEWAWLGLALFLNLVVLGSKYANFIREKLGNLQTPILLQK